MDEQGKKLLNLMFRPGERICVSPDKFAYHCVPLENAFKEKVTLVSPNPSVPIRECLSDELTLVSLNPSNGFRSDHAVTAFRSFLIECDTAPLAQQVSYIRSLGLPYSAQIFSGSKSIHTLITLNQDLPDEPTYRLFAEWILNIATAADQQTKNASRSVRVPGAIRPETGKKQVLVDFKGPVDIKDLAAWLAKHPEAKPRKAEKRKVSGTASLKNVKPWVIKLLTNGLDPTKGRNQQWFAVAVELCLSGYPEDEVVDWLSQFFVEDRDFKEKEWLTTIRSGFKYALEKK
jgi:hypothetical protein